MSTNSHWLLPRQQTEYPARDLLPEATLHGRREATFLVLAALFFVATTALFTLGTSRVIDVSALIASVAPGLDLPTEVLVPLGALPFALSLVASALVCELFGRRRASALVSAGLVAALALAGLMRIADVIDGGEVFGSSLAFAACYVLAHLCFLLGFDALRRRPRGTRLFVRANLVSLVAQGIGWSAFALVLHAGGGYILTPLAPESILALTVGAAAASIVCMLVLSLPAALSVRGLAIALRVGDELVADEDEPVDSDDAPPEAYVGEPKWARRGRALAEGSVARRLPAAEIVEEEPRMTTRGVGLQPYSSAEMRFFNEGDAE